MCAGSALGVSLEIMQAQAHPDHLLFKMFAPCRELEEDDTGSGTRKRGLAPEGGWERRE